MDNNIGQVPSFNPEQFKTQQRQIWDNAAKGWQMWWESFERGAQKVSDKMVELTGIKPGDRVLDIATGVGEPAITAAKKIKPNGNVVATDISRQMIEIAKSRARSLGLDGIIEFREGDVEELDFPKASFNAVLSRWGLMFLPNFPEALTKIKGMLVPGGKLAAAVWSLPSNVPWIDLAFGTVRKELKMSSPPPGMPGSFALADVKVLKYSFIQAGFKDIRVDTFYITLNFDSAESYTRFQQETAAAIQLMLANQTEERKKQIWNSVTDAVSRYADSHGRVNIDNEVICIVANPSRGQCQRW